MLYVKRAVICGTIGEIAASEYYAIVSLAINRPFPGRRGETHWITDWVDLRVIRPDLVQFAADCLRKGAHLYAVARVQSGTGRVSDDTAITQELIAERLDLVT